MKVKITPGKFEGMSACADERGVIAALAVDHRGNLLQAIASSRGPGGQATAADMLAFKTMVTKGRLPDLLPEWSVRRLVEVGAQAIKILLYYNPSDEEQINIVKQAYVERIGAECIALDVPFFLEPLVYDDAIGDEKGLAFARKKPEYVVRAIEEFSKPRYSVDVLKVEVPINPSFVVGTHAFTGEGAAYSRQEAIEHFRAAASTASRPIIYLSAGATDEVFCEMLELAAEAGVKFSGVLCGRATWQEGIRSMQAEVARR
jgi:tagatose 1,6-diphosphate aldolase